MDPVRTLSVQRLADHHLPIRPGTDTPLALALLNEVFINGWDDESFLKLHTNAPLMVREDTGNFLREKDIVKGGSGDCLVSDEEGNL